MSHSLEGSQAVKPGDEQPLSGDRDRDQETDFADAVKQGGDVTERTHAFADLDGVHADALSMEGLRGAQVDPVSGRFAALLTGEVAKQRASLWERMSPILSIGHCTALSSQLRAYR